MHGNGKVGVRVAVRVRPPVRHEIGSLSCEFLHTNEEHKVISIGKCPERAKHFRFDAVFGPDVSQVRAVCVLCVHASAPVLPLELVKHQPFPVPLLPPRRPCTCKQALMTSSVQLLRASTPLCLLVSPFEA